MLYRRYADVAHMHEQWMRAIEFALQVNERYVLGGEDPRNGIDCSGFVIYVLNRCGLQRDHGTGIWNRMRSLDIIRKYFTRPLSWNPPGTSNVLGISEGPTGPDPRFGEFGSFFRAYFYGIPSTESTWHMGLGYGRELFAESTTAYKAVPEIIENTYQVGTNLSVTWTESYFKDGVRIRHVNDIPSSLNGWSTALFMDYDAWNTDFVKTRYEARLPESLR